MSDIDGFDKTNEKKDTKNKQKAGLGAIRPSDYVEQKFREMCAERNISQTDLFESLFWSFLRDSKQEKRNDALECESEISLISKDLNNILTNIRNIAEKAQDKISSITANSEQTAGNLKMDIDTLQKKVEFLEKRNEELEKSNEAFTEIKNGLEIRIRELSTDLKKNIEGWDDALQIIREKEKSIKDLEKQSKIYEKEINSLLQEKERHDNDSETKGIRIHNLEVANASMQTTIDSMEALKKAEISSIEAKNQAILSELQSKLKISVEEKEAVVQTAVQNVRIEMEAEKKLAMAEMKLELAGVKEELAILLTKQSKGKKEN